MNNRSAAREIVILAIPQMPKDKGKFDRVDFDQIILALTRSLRDYAKKNIESVSSDLIRIENYLYNTEIEHPDNEKHTSQIKPVLLPDTKILRDEVNLLKQASTELFNALELPEMIAHTTQENTIEYAVLVAKHYFDNKEKIDSIIEAAAQSRKKEKKWKLERMVRLDRDILRIAATELSFLHDVPIEVICDEAVKIAEKYGGDESKKFVNGVLRDIVFLTRENVKAEN
ncbi:MAG: transcription antitermination factor NusB [Candidatus Melainabacteria bacterium]|nr:transcription antitermination factor NusB [Candidatus Melainabacteria bacterium]